MHLQLPLGTLLNIAAVIVGSLAGMWLHRGFPERYRRILLTAGGLATLALGAQMAVKVGNPLVLIGSLYIGALIGEALGIEAWLERVGDKLQARLGASIVPSNQESEGRNVGKSEVAGTTSYDHGIYSNELRPSDSPTLRLEGDSVGSLGAGNTSRFTTGLITAFLIFCVGPMTILGSLNEGIGGPDSHNLLYVKSGLDLVTSFVMASSFGSGVLFSVVPLAVFQLALTGLGLLVGKALTADIVNELTAVGGALIIGLGLNLLGVVKLRVANLLPALAMVIVIMLLLKYLPYLF